MRFSTCLGLFLLVEVLLFAEDAKADLFYDPITGRLDIDRGLTRSLYLDDDISLGLSLLAGSPLFAQPARPDSHVNPNTGGFDLGSASLFSVLAAGQVSTSDSMSGSAYVEGNVGIGGTESFKMSNGQINGDLYVRTTAKYRAFRTRSGPSHFSRPGSRRPN